MSDYLADHEREVITAILEDCLAAGHVLSVDDGEELAVEKSSDQAAILAEMCQTGEDSLIIHTADGRRIGHVFLVYGNEPGVVICDYADNAEIRALLERAEAIGERLNEAA